MGDRSNIVIHQDNGDRVYLYGHWMGEDSINVVWDVLSLGVRWDDESYLARMMFCKMVQGSFDSETGFGISANYPPDNEYPFIVLYPKDMTVQIETEQKAVTPRIPMQMFLDYMPREDERTFDNVIDTFNHVMAVT